MPCAIAKSALSPVCLTFESMHNFVDLYCTSVSRSLPAYLRRASLGLIKARLLALRSELESLSSAIAEAVRGLLITTTVSG